MKEFKAEAFIDGKSCGERFSTRRMEDARRGALADISHALYVRKYGVMDARQDAMFTQANAVAQNLKEGEVQTVSAEIAAVEIAAVEIKLVQTCLVSRRAPARPHEVIQKEKEERSARATERAQEEAERKQKQEAERLEAEARLRQRVRNQIDHAFLTGVSGSEPVAKYITCGECDAPAAVLYLSQKIQKGATALDEETIVDVRCGLHATNTRYCIMAGAYSTDGVECSRLEFFYDGVRQITIKDAA